MVVEEAYFVNLNYALIKVAIKVKIHGSLKFLIALCMNFVNQ